MFILNKRLFDFFFFNCESSQAARPSKLKHITQVSCSAKRFTKCAHFYFKWIIQSLPLNCTGIEKVCLTKRRGDLDQFRAAAYNDFHHWLMLINCLDHKVHILSDQSISKPQRYWFYNDINQKTANTHVTEDGTRERLAFLLKKWLKWLIAHRYQNSLNLLIITPIEKFVWKREAFWTLAL